MQNQGQKLCSCSKDLLKQYRIMQTYFAEGLLPALLSYLLFSVGCIILCYCKYASGTILKILWRVLCRCSHTEFFSHYEVLTVSTSKLICFFHLNLIFKRCDGKRQPIYQTVPFLYYKVRLSEVCRKLLFKKFFHWDFKIKTHNIWRQKDQPVTAEFSKEIHLVFCYPS